MSLEYRRLTHALLLSLLIHTLLLGLTFGGQGLWLPGFGFPWQIRRIKAPDLRVAVVPAQRTVAEPAVTPVAAPLQQARVERPVAGGPALAPSVSRAPTPRPSAAAIMPEVDPRAEATSRTDAATGAVPAQMPLRADRPGDATPPPIPAPAVIALARTDEAKSVVRATPAMPTPSVSSPDPAMRSLRDAGDAARAPIAHEAPERAVEPAKPDTSRQEGQRQAEQLEAARQEAARQEAARAENGATGRGHAGRGPHGSRPHGSRPHGSRPQRSRPQRSMPHGSRPHGSRAHGSTLRKRKPPDGKRCFGR